MTPLHADIMASIYRELELRDANHANVHAAAAAALSAALDAQNKQHSDLDDARQIAHESLTHRLEGMNLFREQLSQQASTFVSASELAIIRQSNAATILRLQESVRELELSRPTRVEVTNQHDTSQLNRLTNSERLRQVELMQGNLQARLYTVTGFLGIAMAAATILLAVFR